MKKIFETTTQIQCLMINPWTTGANKRHMKLDPQISHPSPQLPTELTRSFPGMVLPVLHLSDLASRVNGNNLDVLPETNSH